MHLLFHNYFSGWSYWYLHPNYTILQLRNYLKTIVSLVGKSKITGVRYFTTYFRKWPDGLYLRRFLVCILMHVRTVQVPWMVQPSITSLSFPKIDAILYSISSIRNLHLLLYKFQVPKVCFVEDSFRDWALTLATEYPFLFHVRCT